MNIKKTFYFIIAVIVLANLCSCWLVPIKYHDKKLIPYLQAITKVEHLRDSLGFTHISENAKITLEGSSDNYDAMLHIYQSVSSRTIAFKKDGDHYAWIGEQEIFTGPQKYETVDGTLNEELVVNYDKQPISGYPTNILNISYNGPDSSYTSPRKLSIPEAQAIIKKWQH